MSDVIEQPVVEAPVEEVQTEEIVETEVETQETEQSEKPKGDLSIALRQERQRRQELEARLQELEGTQQTEKVEEEGYSYDPTDVSSLVRFEMDKEKALEKYPDLKKDKDLQVMVTSFINTGMSPMKAADKVMSRFTQVEQKAKLDGMKEEAQVLTDKEQAQTVSGVSKNTATLEVESLRDQARSRNPEKQKTALLKLLELDYRKSQGR